MKKIILATFAIVIAVGLGIFANAINNASATSATRRVSNYTLDDVIRTESGAITSVVVTNGTNFYIFKTTRQTLIKDRKGQTLNNIHLRPGDKVSVWATALGNTNETAGTASKIVDLSMWKVDMTGVVSNIDEVGGIFNLNKTVTVDALDLSVPYALDTHMLTTTIYYQKEVTKSGTRTISSHTLAKAYTDITDQMRVRVVGYWRKSTNTLFATRVQLPTITVVSTR